MTATHDFAYFRGNYVPFEQAKVSVLNRTFMYGLGVFEGIRGYWNEEHGQIYLVKLREHIERMFESMKIMHLTCKHNVDEVCEIIIELVKMNAPKTDMYVRPSIYMDDSDICPSINAKASDLCIVTLPLGDYVDTKAGLKVQVASWRRVEDNAIPARAKIIGAYVNTALAKTDATLAGFDDCIMLSENGHVAEGSAMNLFMVKRGKLFTTAVTDNILEGITRSTIMELAEKEFGMTTCDRSIDRSELYTADELFFCGTGAQVAPVTSVDHRQIGDGNPGKVSIMFRDAYIQACRGNLPQFKSWLTAVDTSAAAVLPIPTLPDQLTA